MKRNTVLRAVTITLALLLGARTMYAQRDRDRGTLDTTLSVRSGTRLTINNMSGQVIVRGWNRNQVRIVAESDQGRSVEIDESPGRIGIRTVMRRGHAEVEYSISAPSGTPIEINGTNLDVDVTGVCGPLRVTTINGDVNADCTGDNSSVQTVNGDVTVVGARGVLEAATTSGDVDVRNASGDVMAHTTSGDVSLSDIGGAIVTAETVSGDVSYTGRVLDNGRYTLEAHSGDVFMRVLGNFNATVSVETFSGEFEADFPIELAPGTTISKRMEFRRGTGSARVRLRSFSGTIGLRLGAGGTPREE
jgi:DUF4097 and DUF4098 domain-containing protein YvlB